MENNWKRRTLGHFLQRLRTTVSVELTPGSSRSMLSRTADTLPQSQDTSLSK